MFTSEVCKISCLSRIFEYLSAIPLRIFTKAGFWLSVAMVDHNLSVFRRQTIKDQPATTLSLYFCINHLWVVVSNVK